MNRLPWRTLLTVASFAVGALVILDLSRRSGASPSSMAGLISPTTHVVVLAIFLAEVVLRGVRIQLIASGLGLPLRLGTATITQFSADAAGAVTPSRTGSDPAKMLVMRRDGIRTGPSAAILMGEHLAEAVILLLGGVAVVIFAPGLRMAAWGAGVYAVLSGGFVVAAFMFARLPGDDPPRFWRWTRLSRARWEALRTASASFRDRGAALRYLSPARWFGVALATLGHIAARVAVLPLLALPFVSPDVLPDLIAWPVVLFYVGALVPPPGGGGAVELGFATTLDQALGPEVLAATLLWWRVYTFYLSAMVGWVCLMALGARVGAENPASTPS